MRISRLLTYPWPLRLAFTFKLRSWMRGFAREHYYQCVKSAATEARALGILEISVIEFGVAGGNGLVELEKICRYVLRETGVSIRSYGFDLGSGLPPPIDYRDTPWKWGEGWYAMDRAVLEARLESTKLVIGDCAITIKSFFHDFCPPPIGAVMFDLDYFSSTEQALEIFHKGEDVNYLPRIHCYFDDLGTIPSVGVPLAIANYNAKHARQRLEQNMRTAHLPDPYALGWKLFEHHDFDHPLYKRQIKQRAELPLTRR